MEDTPAGRLDYATSRLQKGFLLLDRGQNLAEEAVGFGVPVLKRGLQTIFPGNVTLSRVRRDSIWDISTVFELNLVEKISRTGKGNVENEFLYAAKNISAAVIRHLPFSRAFLDRHSQADVDVSLGDHVRNGRLLNHGKGNLLR
jgi:hypothetical protein